MTSQDNQQYITVELFNARMERLEAIIERNLAVSRADIAELKAFVEKSNSELKAEISGVRSELKADIANVHSELKSEIASVRSELKAEIADVRSEVRIQSTRIDNLVHWNYWFIALFVAFFLMPSVIEGIRSTFKALSDGITALFKRKNSD